MFDSILNFFKKLTKSKAQDSTNSKDTAKERLHLVLMQDRANVSADFLELMKQEIIDVIKKYIEVDESAIDVRLTNKTSQEGENGAPALYANIPILNIRNDMKKIDITEEYNKKENVGVGLDQPAEPKTEPEKGKQETEEKIEESKEKAQEEQTEPKEDNQNVQEEKVEVEN